MPSSDLLAVAFTDLNGNNKYNPNKDTLIAALVDTSGDGVVSVGDTIQWGTYPAIPDGSASGVGGIYTRVESTITNVVDASSSLVSVETARGSVVWFASANQEEFQTRNALNEPESRLLDSINFPTLPDAIVADSTAFGAGAPNFDVQVLTPQLGDQGFLDVLVF